VRGWDDDAALAATEVALGPDPSTRRPAAPPPRRWRAVALAAAVLALVAATDDGSVGADRLRSGGAARVPDVPTDLGPRPEPPATATSASRPSTTAVVAPGTAAPTAAPSEPTDPPAAEPAAGEAPPAVDGAAAPPAPDPPAAADDAVVSRAIPDVAALAPPPAAAPPWAASTHTTAAGYVSTDAGCAAGTSGAALDAWFAGRMGPVLGHDYQHVYPLGDGRHLWLFQDTFIDHGGGATTFDGAAFAHNTALVQEGACFTLLHRGSAAAPASFEPGTGERRLATWFWPMGGEAVDGRLQVVWAEMRKDPYEPGFADGLGWHPVRTWLGVYDTSTLRRLAFAPAPDPGVAPIYGYAVASAGEWTYLFGNTFEQNLVREGGYWNGPHSATAVFLARVPRGQLGASPEYRTADGWSPDPAAATPISQRYWVENPMQPRYLGGQWVSVAKVDGYWGEELVVDVANEPWGPWTTVAHRALPPRGGDPLMNTYHAHLLPWLEGDQVVVTVSQNARNMRRDAWPAPWRYRLRVVGHPLVPPPPDPAPIPEETSTTAVDTTPAPETSSAPPPDTAAPATTATTTSIAPATTVAPTTSIAPTTTTIPSGSSTSTSTAPAPTTAAPASTAPVATAPPPATSGSSSTTAPAAGPGAAEPAPG